MPRAGTARSPPYRHAARRQSRAVSENKFLHLALDLGKGGVECLPARIDHNRPLGTQPIQAHAQGLAHAPPDAVPDDGAAQRARRGKPDARAARRARKLGFAETEGCEQAARKPRAVVVDSAEILRPEQANAFRKCLITVAKDVGDYLSELTVSFLRPRARRREITARPSAVFIRVRKPCVFARCRLFG